MTAKGTQHLIGFRIGRGMRLIGGIMTKPKKDILADLEQRIKDLDLDNQKAVSKVLREISKKKEKKGLKKIWNIVETPSTIQ